MTENENEMFDFEDYYGIVREKLAKAGYQTAPDRDCVRLDYYEDKSPEESAEEFIQEWKELGIN